jgi:deazaflavin-dependent oxidoreductase (nitroreductase family)
MPKVYRVGAGQRAVNVVFRQLAAWGRGNVYLHVLTVTGRTSGLDRSVPVDVMKLDGVKYLVAPYGEVNWVRNLRVARKATLRRGSRAQEYEATEVPPADAIRIIREYVRLVPITKNYWNVNADSTNDEVLEDARGHPVFELRTP